MSSRGRGRSLWFKAVSHHEALEARADRIMKNFAAYRRAKILRPPAKLLLSLPSPCPSCQALSPCCSCQALRVPNPQVRVRLVQVQVDVSSAFLASVCSAGSSLPGPSSSARCWCHLLARQGKFRRRPVSNPSHTCIPHEKDAEDRQSIGRQEGAGGVVYVLGRNPT